MTPPSRLVNSDVEWNANTATRPNEPTRRLLMELPMACLASSSSGISFRFARDAIASIPVGFPNVWLATITLVLEVIFEATSRTLLLRDLASQSTKTGIAPRRNTQAVVDGESKVGTITSSFVRTPIVSRAICIAQDAEDIATAYEPPACAATADSNLRVQGPRDCVSPLRASDAASISRLVISAQLSGMLVDKLNSYGEVVVAAASA